MVSSKPSLAPAPGRVLALGLIALVSVACELRQPGRLGDGIREIRLRHSSFVVELGEDPPDYPLADPADAELLEPLYFPEPVGEGYPRVPVELGETLHRGKWLGFAQGRGRFLGPRHVIVTHYAEPPKNPFTAEVDHSVLLDVEAGEAVAEFHSFADAQWRWGLAIVWARGADERPYLLDAEHPDLVLALPAGDHGYEYGENWWLRLSPIAKRVWITARDDDGQVHLYEWQDLSEPPPLPDNPFPYLPEEWDPRDSSGLSRADTEEVRGDGPCSPATLEPPRSWSCPDEDRLYETLPLSGGWRLDQDESVVFNSESGEGLDLSGLCGDGGEVFAKRLRRAPPQVRVTCSEDDGVWMLWTPPDRLRRLRAEQAQDVNQVKNSLFYHSTLDQYELWRSDPDGIDTWVDTDELVRELVADDRSCAEEQGRGGNGSLYARVCKDKRGRVSWVELVDTELKTRGRFVGKDVVLGPNGVALGVTRAAGDEGLHMVNLRPYPGKVPP